MFTRCLLANGIITKISDLHDSVFLNYLKDITKEDEPNGYLLSTCANDKVSERYNIAILDFVTSSITEEYGKFQLQVLDDGYGGMWLNALGRGHDGTIKAVIRYAQYNMLNEFLRVRNVCIGDLKPLNFTYETYDVEVEL